MTLSRLRDGPPRPDAPKSRVRSDRAVGLLGHFMKMTIECPASSCGHHFADRNRASLIAALGSQVDATEVNHEQQSTTRCPECGRAVEFGLLMLDDDGVWRVSRFAGHANDVTVIRPPGGGVSYGTGIAELPGEPSQPPPGATWLSAGELKARDRALAVVEGRAPNVPLAARHDAVEVALEAGVLSGNEAAVAGAWLAQHAAR